MASIAIYDLRPAGYDLLSDTESFMSNLSEEELKVHAGIRYTDPWLSPFYSLASPIYLSI